MGGPPRPPHLGMTRVKICGITNLQDAMTAVDAGADALGFIFVENTPRFVTPEKVAPIVRALPPFVTPVGIFWDQPMGHIKAVQEACGLRALQFHGDEKPEDLDGYSVPVVKTIKLPAPTGEIGGMVPWTPTVKFLAYRAHAAALLLDSAARWSEGEARQPIEWSTARDLANVRWRIILAAGLTPENVARAVATAHPYAVDVNSGVEAQPGRKDPDKVWRFVAEAKGAR
jgi:phosphoribosylanthranilate isomerase